MITGYNTDVRHRGLVFHVQTEDKGMGNPCVESLIYVGGQILGRRRSEYSHLVKDGEADKDAVLKLLEKQHREMIAEIRAGKMDADAEKQLGPIAAVQVPEGPDLKPKPTPADADSEPSSTPSLDQVILDYLNMEAAQEHLVLVMDSTGELDLGREALLAFHAKSSGAGEPVVGADVAVKLISTVSEPAVLGSGVTNDDGNLNIRVQIPDIARGTAALIIQASSDLGSAEIKHLI